MVELKLFFEEYGSFVCIQDLGIVHHGTLITHIAHADKDIQLWAGNPNESKYAEQIMLSEDALEIVIRQVLNLM